MQYDMLYIEVMARLTEDTFSSTQFYSLLQMVDEYMRPVWEVSSLPTSKISIQVPTVDITPTVVDSETTGPSRPIQVAPFVTATATASMPTTLERWQTLPLGPLGSSKMREEQGLIVVQSPLVLEETKQFYTHTLQAEDWTLLEQLSTVSNQFGGESFFLLFWRIIQNESRTETACVHGVSDPTLEGNTFVFMGDCVFVRNIAEDTLVEPWTRPTTVTWDEWQDESLALTVPAGWSEDKELFAQPYCQEGSGIECLTAFKLEEATSVAQFSVISQVRVPEKSLLDSVKEARQNTLQADGELLPIALLQIRLDDGREAIQDIVLRPMGNTTGIFLTIHTFTDISHIIMTGTAFGEQAQVLEKSALLTAIARSVHAR
jgi:hypothetical protein